MKDFNKINSPEDQESQSTGWEDVADFAPKKQKSIDEIRDKFNSAYSKWDKIKAAKLNIENIYSSMNKGETTKDRLAAYRSIAQESDYNDSYKKMSEFDKREVESYTQYINNLYDKKDYLKYSNRTPVKKFFDKLRFGFSKKRRWNIITCKIISSLTSLKHI